MLKIFKSYSPNNYLLLFFYLLLLKWPMLIQSDIPVRLNGSGLLSHALGWLFSGKGVLQLIFSKSLFLSLMYIQSVLINKIAQDQRMFARPNYIPGMTYILCSSFFLSWNQLNESMISLTIVIWTAGALCRIYNISDPKRSLFNIGMALGVSTLIFFPSIFYLLMLMIGLSVMRPFRMAEWIILFVGLATPYYFIACFDYLNDTNSLSSNTSLIFNLPRVQLNLITAIIVVLSALLLFAGFYQLNTQMTKLLVNARKSWSLFFVFLLISLVIPWMDKTTGIVLFSQVTAPLALLIAAYFFYARQERLAGFIHWVLIVSVWISLYFFSILERML